MAAYAALTSLNNLLHQIQNHHSPPISIDKKQVESLTEIVTFLQEFLETYQSPVSDGDEADPLEMRIADAAYAAEDVIESHIVDAIKLGRSTITSHQKIDPIDEPSTSSGLILKSKSKKSFDYFGCLMKPINTGKKVNLMYTLSQGLRKVIKDMDVIKKKVKEKTTVKAQLQRNVSTSAASSRSSIMVGFKDVLLEILDKLTAEERRRQVIPIVGMGGIGKTTLARHLYAHPSVKEHFDVCVWVTISQTYNTKEILCDLLSQANKKSKDQLSNISEQELELEVHKHLFCRRFLIVMDDMWSIHAWDKMQCFFPDNGNRSRIVVTTRLSTLGSQLDNSYCLKMKFLDDDSSWELFLKTVFGEESCPTELKETGKKIVESCKGLPLPIVVMGGLLKNLEHTQECWESIRKNSSSVGNSESEDFCLKILKLSYNHLPVYLKPCFLYMGVFEEDHAVRISTLVKLWVSEGFLKPVFGKTLETAAKEYLNDLVDRNLIQVHELGSIGNIKYCKIHDLLRDLGLREAEKEGFYNVIGQHKFQGLNRQRCVVIRGSTSKVEVDGASLSMPFARSFLCDTNEVVPLPESRLLRILKAYDTSGSRDYWFDDLFGYVNSRYLAVGVHWESQFSSSVSLLWNLQTLIVFHSVGVTAPEEFWNLSQLRHVEFHKGVLRLSYPERFVIHKRVPRLSYSPRIENLQTLKGFCCNGRINLAIPNIRKLGVTDGRPPSLKGLTKLESYHCRATSPNYNNLINYFPYSLKKLSLGSFQSFSDGNDDLLLETVAALPLLQKLKLGRGKFKEWKTRDDGFPSLKYLELYSCALQSWMTESSHFPRLERLHLYELKELEEIPSEIGEIATLQSLVLEYCSESSVESAKNIAEEQEDVQVRVVLFNIKKNQALRSSLATSNFVVETVNI